MSIIYDMNKLGVKLIENEMEYGHFTDDERIAIAGALGFEFIRVPYSQHYDSLKMFDDVYKEGDMVYILYDTGREAYSSYMDGWGNMDTCDINVNIDACFDSILEPYVTEYFENIVLPDLPSNGDTLRSTMVKLLHKITECIPDYSDILVPILVPGNTWHTIKYNMNAYPRYMHTTSNPNSIILHYDSIEFKKVNKVSIELVTEILYTIICAIDHVRIATDDGVEQIICAEHVKMDAIDAYLDSLDPNLPDMIVEARKGYATEKDAFDPIMKTMLDE